MTKDTYLKLMLTIARSYKNYTVIYCSYPKELRLNNTRNVRQQEKRHHTHKNLKTGTESWIETQKSTQGNRVQSRSIAKAAHEYENGVESKRQE